MNMHFPDDMIALEKWIPEKPISVLYFNGQKDCYFVKRFLAGNQNNDQKFIPDGSKIQLNWFQQIGDLLLNLLFLKPQRV